MQRGQWMEKGLNSMASANKTHKDNRKHISLALQGGGSHGAYTWGVLTRFIEDRRLFIDGLSGTSAGAMNAVMFAEGFRRGKRQGAIDHMAEFWHRIAETAEYSPLKPTPFRRMMGSWRIGDNPAYNAFDLFTRLFSPYEFNPFDYNPLRKILDDMIDYEALQAHDEFKIFVTATNVKSSKSKIFRTPDLTCNAILASACLPFMFKAVEVNGEHYWDGGYMGNPKIYPLIHECRSNDVLIVQINPMQRPDVPRTARDILNRVNEISFNSSLVREMSGIALISDLIKQGEMKAGRYQQVNFHIVDGEQDLIDVGAASKVNADKKFLLHLFEMGHAAADAWIEQNVDKIGVESTFDVLQKFAPEDS